MKSSRCVPVGCVLLLSVVWPLMTGCKPDVAPDAVTTGQAANQLTNAFGQAGGELKEFAQGVADSMNGSSDDSLARLQALGQSPDLTPEQRQALGQSQAAVLKKLREAAASGNQQAAEQVERYRASK